MRPPGWDEVREHDMRSLGEALADVTGQRGRPRNFKGMHVLWWECGCYMRVPLDGRGAVHYEACALYDHAEQVRALWWALHSRWREDRAAKNDKALEGL